MVGKPKDRVRQPPTEGLVVAELLEEFGVVLQHRGHHTRQGLVVLDSGILPVRVLLGILVGRVGGHPGGDLLCDQLVDAICIGPRDVAELVVERLQNARQVLKLGLCPVAATRGGHRLDLGVLVGKLDLHRRLLLDAVTVHVDCIQDALRQVFLHRRGQFRDEEVEKDRKLLPPGIRVRQD